MPASLTTRIEALLRQAERMKQQAARGMLKTLKSIEAEKAKRASLGGSPTQVFLRRAFTF